MGSSPIGGTKVIIVILYWFVKIGVVIRYLSSVGRAIDF